MVHLWCMPAAKGKSPLNVPIDARVKVAALRVFAGKKRGSQLCDYVQRALIKRCIEAGEAIPLELLPKRRSA